MAPGAADEATTERLAQSVTDLAHEAEVVRGLRFIDMPNVLVLEPDAYAARLSERYGEWIATSAPVGKSGVYQALGLLRFETVASILSRLAPTPTPAFYDPTASQMVMSSDADILDSAVTAATFHELILALTDQYHHAAQTRADLVAAGADDELRAFDALVEGDATYFQLVWIQGLSLEEQAAIAEAFAATDSPVVAGIPDFIRADLAFPYDAGTTFVSDLVATGGIAAVDQAYRNPPTSSEHILHPERFRRGESPVAVTPLDITIDGATVSRSATFGELQLDQVLSLSLQAGLVTQAADGWQGDQYQIVETTDGVAFALSLAMESNDDAIEVVGGLIAHARDVLEAGDGVESAGGLLWDEGSRFVFIDRVGDGLLYILATDVALGRAVRDQVSAP